MKNPCTVWGKQPEKLVFIPEKFTMVAEPNRRGIARCSKLYWTAHNFLIFLSSLSSWRARHKSKNYLPQKYCESLCRTDSASSFAHSEGGGGGPSKVGTPAEISNGDKRFLLQPALNFPCIVRKERQADREKGKGGERGAGVQSRDSQD